MSPGRWTTFVGASLVLAGCGSDPPTVARPSPTAAVRAAAISTASAVATQRPSPKPPSPPPAWLDPDFDESTAPFRAHVVRLPELFGDERNLALNDRVGPSRCSMFVSVTEEPERRDSERVRVLCASPKERVALFVNRADLELVTRRNGVLTALEAELDTVRDDPGVARMTFDAGVSVRVDRALSTMVVPVSYYADNVSVHGFMRRADLDEVYEWPVTGATIVPNGEIPHDATFLSAPGGKSLAWLAELPNKGTYSIETVGEPSQGYIFVRARIKGGILSGWIDQSMKKIGLGSPGSGAGVGAGVRTSGGPRVALPKGTLLTLGDGAIGVIKMDTSYPCISDCRSARPTITVTACQERIELVAQFPDVTK